MCKKRKYFYTLKLINGFAPEVSRRLKNTLKKIKSITTQLLLNADRVRVLRGERGEIIKLFMKPSERAVINHTAVVLLIPLHTDPFESNIRTRLRSISSRTLFLQPGVSPSCRRLAEVVATVFACKTYQLFGHPFDPKRASFRVRY